MCWQVMIRELQSARGVLLVCFLLVSSAIDSSAEPAYLVCTNETAKPEAQIRKSVIVDIDAGRVKWGSEAFSPATISDSTVAWNFRDAYGLIYLMSLDRVSLDLTMKF